MFNHEPRDPAPVAGTQHAGAGGAADDERTEE